MFDVVFVEIARRTTGSTPGFSGVGLRFAPVSKQPPCQLGRLFFSRAQTPEKQSARANHGPSAAAKYPARQNALSSWAKRRASLLAFSPSRHQPHPGIGLPKKRPSRSGGLQPPDTGSTAKSKTAPPLLPDHPLAQGSQPAPIRAPRLPHPGGVLGIIYPRRSRIDRVNSGDFRDDFE